MNGKRRREKKLKLVLKLPKPDTNSTSFSSTGEESNGEEEKNTGSNKKKRKINASEIEKVNKKFKLFGKMVGKLTKGKLLEKRVCVSNVGILTSV